jgi:2,3-bisphosphoglycerate-dependent phosphoglycerate mutase
MAKIFLFRHGQSTYNAQGLQTGWKNPELTDKGVLEAKSIRDRLRNEKVTKAYTSDQIRSIETMKIVLEPHQGITPTADPRLKERNYGILEGQKKKEMALKYPDLYPKWHRSYEVPPPEGESIKQVEERVLEFLKEVLSEARPEDVIFICSHGNSLRPIRRYFEKMTIDEMVSFEHERGKIYSYEI